MLIHFAFGSQKNNTDLQTKSIIECILAPRQLKFSTNCYEFLPALVYPMKDGYLLNMRKCRLVEEGCQPLPPKDNCLIPIDKRMVKYLPEIVNMICFINIPFNKLKSSEHYLTYGMFGLVFGESFRRRFGLGQVVYYEEMSLFNDRLVLLFNELMYINSRFRTDANEIELAQLRTEILSYRKPSKLWPSFGESVVVNISNNNPDSKCKLTYSQYDRYPQGYDFTKEQEWRIVSSTGMTEYINFSEDDLEIIIVPDIRSRDSVHEFLVQSYKALPKIFLFPN